jgi:hypothetical protein
MANTGTANGASTVRVYVNGVEESQQGVKINSGGKTQIHFDITRDEPGNYSVYVGGPGRSFYGRQGNRPEYHIVHQHVADHRFPDSCRIYILEKKMAAIRQVIR